MPTEAKTEGREDGTWTALPMRAPEGWHAWLIPLLPLPIAPRQRTGYAQVASSLVEAIRGTRERSVFLEMAELHKDNAIRQLSVHGSKWSPEMGIGVYPDKPAPRLWNYAELSEMSVNDPFPSLILSVAHIDAPEDGRSHAVETMCGTGGLLQVIHRSSMDDLMTAWRDELLPTIEEPGLRAFAFYIPLLSGQCVRNCTKEQLDRWMGAVDVYLRESMDDKGLLLVSREPLERSLTIAGLLNDSMNG